MQHLRGGLAPLPSTGAPCSKKARALRGGGRGAPALSFVRRRVRLRSSRREAPSAEVLASAEAAVLGVDFGATSMSDALRTVGIVISAADVETGTAETAPNTVALTNPDRAFALEAAEWFRRSLVE